VIFCLIPSSPIVIHNGTAILPDRLLPDARLVIRDGRIAEIRKTTASLPQGAVAIDA
jgi:hypothetical protein